MLLRAFGPVDLPAPPGLEPATAVRVSRRFALAARIASRTGRERLADELGGAAAELQRLRAKAVGAEMILAATARDVAEIASELSFAPIFLKFTALHFGGFLAPGSRHAGDVDVLVPAAHAPIVQQRLTARDYAAADYPAMDHQLPPLAREGGGMVEVHLHLPGVAADAGTGRRRRFATAEDLVEAGLTAPLPGLPPKALAPVVEVLLAHALAHGLAQHAFTPQAYPLLRTLADTIDLGLASPDGRALAEGAARHVSPWVPQAEVLAARELALLLASGELETLDAGSGPPQLLLRHLLAGTLDATYRESLKLRLAAASLSDRSSGRVLVDLARRNLFLTRGQLDAIYGPHRSAGSYLLLRLVRPLDLLVRWLRSAASWVALRLRRRR